jgi:hypothetical protein
VENAVVERMPHDPTGFLPLTAAPDGLGALVPRHLLHAVQERPKIRGGQKPTNPQLLGVQIIANTSKRIKSPQSFGNRQVNANHNNRHEAEGGGERNVSGIALLGVNHLPNKIAWRTNHARDDVIAQSE